MGVSRVGDQQEKTMSNRIDKSIRFCRNWKRPGMNRTLSLFPILSVQASPGTSGLVAVATPNTLIVTVVVILVVGITGAVVVWASRS